MMKQSDIHLLHVSAVIKFWQIILSSSTQGRTLEGSFLLRCIDIGPALRHTPLPIQCLCRLDLRLLLLRCRHARSLGACSCFACMHTQTRALSWCLQLLCLHAHSDTCALLVPAAALPACTLRHARSLGACSCFACMHTQTGHTQVPRHLCMHEQSLKHQLIMHAVHTNRHTTKHLSGYNM